MTNEMDKRIRCPWCMENDLYIAYHDTEWGIPVHNDRVLFEFLILEGAQAGLSWITILKKRDAYRKAFDQFDPEVIAQYDEKKIENLMSDIGIVRNRLKIHAAISNARAFLDICRESGSFDAYIWQFIGGRPFVRRPKTMADVPSVSEEAERMSRDLRRSGFRFVGPTICYAYMQAVGMVNDHIATCFRIANE